MGRSKHNASKDLQNTPILLESCYCMRKIGVLCWTIHWGVCYFATVFLWTHLAHTRTEPLRTWPLGLFFWKKLSPVYILRNESGFQSCLFSAQLEGETFSFSELPSIIRGCIFQCCQHLGKPSLSCVSICVLSKSHVLWFFTCAMKK